MKDEPNKKKLRRPIPWESGYIHAVAVMVRQHREIGMAEDALRCFPGIYHIDWRKTDPSDFETLLPVLEEINRKNSLKWVPKQT